MNGQWGSKEAQESARTLTTALSLEETCLRAVPEFIADEREPSEILGDIFTALRRQYPDDYMLAFKAAASEARGKRCRACDKKAWKRGYCSAHYHKARKAGDIPARRTALTAQERIDIKYAKGTYSQIAESFCVSKATVGAIKNGK